MIGYIQDREDVKYSYVDWMEEQGISAESYEKYARELKHGDTDLSYKEWLKK